MLEAGSGQIKKNVPGRIGEQFGGKETGPHPSLANKATQAPCRGECVHFERTLGQSHEMRFGPVSPDPCTEANRDILQPSTHLR